MSLTKSVHVAVAALPIIATMTWEANDQGFIGRLTCGQLERPLYVRVNKGLVALGGKWSRKLGGHVFTTDPRPQVAQLLGSGIVEVEKDGFFVTPRGIGTQMANLACLVPGIRVLEPSAGTGELADAILDVCSCELWVAEKNEQRQQVLRDGGYRLLHAGDYDFLTCDVGLWPRIIQNPPFEDGQDMEHIKRAFDCLEGGGILVSVISESPFFCDYNKHRTFRDWLDSLVHDVVDLPPNAFKESGTGVKARLVRIQK